VEIRPIHYVYHDGRIYGRTAQHAVIFDAAPPGSSVAFEVDEAVAGFRHPVPPALWTALDKEGLLKEDTG
jgi:hypothetical protein